mgnify:CR=1 FL=1
MTMADSNRFPLTERQLDETFQRLQQHATAYETEAEREAAVDMLIAYDMHARYGQLPSKLMPELTDE